jgi:hypothetical protein
MERDHEWPGVFVSSTCLDLIDLRAELEPFLRDLGFLPMLSDRPSHFEVAGDRDAISTCLENVRNASEFICVLSQRYGARLKDRGFDDVSTTHLEYRTARNAKIPIHFYVRDRLLAEYRLWLDNREATFSWVKKEDHGLFELMAEHDKLEKGDKSNWITPFPDSVELKARIAFDLKKRSRKLLLRKLLEGGSVPSLSLSSRNISSGAQGLHVVLIWKNVGRETAYRVELREGSGGWRAAGELSPTETTVQELSRPNMSPFETKLIARYSTLLGDTLEQEYVYKFEDPGKARPHHVALRLLDALDLDSGSSD